MALRRLIDENSARFLFLYSQSHTCVCIYKYIYIIYNYIYMYVCRYVCVYTYMYVHSCGGGETLLGGTAILLRVACRIARFSQEPGRLQTS